MWDDDGVCERELDGVCVLDDEGVTVRELDGVPERETDGVLVPGVDVGVGVTSATLASHALPFHWPTSACELAAPPFTLVASPPTSRFAPRVAKHLTAFASPGPSGSHVEPLNVATFMRVFAGPACVVENEPPA